VVQGGELEHYWQRVAAWQLAHELAHAIEGIPLAASEDDARASEVLGLWWTLPPRERPLYRVACRSLGRAYAAGVPSSWSVPFESKIT
jgi:hypothetical protein